MPTKNPSMDTAPEIKMIPLQELKLWDENARFITDKNFKHLCSLMKKKPDMLWKNPVHANKDGTVYSGNMRYRAALALKWEGIPAVVSPVQMSEEDMIEEAIILNHHHGEDEIDELREQLFKLDEAGYDAYILGVPESTVDLALDKSVLDDLHGDEADEVIDMPTKKNTRVKKGDIWELGDHLLMCGDATKIEDVEKLMEGAVADMIFTDPPYNVDYEGKTKKKLKIENDKMENIEFLQFLRDAFTNLSALAKPGAPIYICHADSEGYNFRKAMIESGWLLKQCIIWVKNKIVLGRQDYQWQHEPILYGWNDGGSHFWYGGRDQSTTWFIDRPARSEDHPTTKPVELCAKAIKNSSKREEIVVDTFGGSGSTLLACEKLSRKCRTMEIDEKYCDVIILRWEKLTGEKAALRKK